MTSILIVEDGPLMAEALKLQLIDCGYQIAALVSNGEEAVKQTQASPPDLVLMDIVLPGKMDGIEAANKIRESCDIPVLYLTAYADDAFFQRAQVTEPYAYLLKPSSPREIQLAIEIALYRHKTERTARTKLEKAVTKRTAELEQAQRRITSILENISDAFVSLDADWHYTYVNAKAGEFFGHKPETLIGKHIWTEFPEGVGQPFYHAYHKAMAEQTPIELEAYYPPWERWFENRIYPSKEGLSIFFHDITERKKTALELATYRDHLEKMVEVRTADLEATNRELEAFSYSVSHDLRAPLRAMQGFAQALEEDYGAKLGSTGLDYIQRIVTSAQRMDTLIQDLLAYSQLARADIEIKPVSLTGAVMEALDQLDVEIKQSGAQITVAPSLSEVIGHAPTLAQIISNLLGNAIKFVPSGTRPSVEVWTEERGERVRLWVADNGIGISPEHQKRIFRVFERLHGVETYPGTGIGLAIVRKGAERMGGEAGVEAMVGKGSRFWVELGKPPSTENP
ncbi:PAS/PAC sensor signal transduction histidine kinase [Sulfuricella denitrificans skB26]|uniref:histidine kinase n=1 Tax=Sulfuricella denitrificans (strain DSM 22764 / NBRC 105220 / skB26) TaxID=1163617 RepID=S6B530_SULDS|nr:ATP-binding protein [Sulfuricella denitrificans]BAN35672.1 PAS/PAC sensor signal transduction histidine kinase [Sulfuricella denitrificans skB26]